MNYQIADNLFLNRVFSPIPTEAKPNVETPTDYIVAIDCSGSMYRELPRIRTQLKKKLRTLLKEQDTVSIVWFSGRDEFGTLLEAEPVATLTDLQRVEQQIDRWLKPICLTGFKQPLGEAARIAKKLKADGRAISLLFMSDGYDNQWGRADILKAVEEAAGHVSSATFVEYGWYADRNLLSQMAERSGGTLIFAENFDQYDPQFEAVLKKRPLAAPKKEVTIPGDVIGGFVYELRDGELVTYGVKDGQITVPQDATNLFYLSPTGKGEAKLATAAYACQKGLEGMDDTLFLSAAYAALSLFAVRMQPNVVFPILKALGDVRFIQAFSTCFGKQKYSAFSADAQEAAFDHSTWFTEGYDPELVPADDAFTVLDVLNLLASDPKNRVLLDHPEFSYNRISRGRIDADLTLTPEEQDEVERLTKEMTETRDAAKVASLAQKIASLTASKESLKFVANENPDGYSVANLTFNQENPNISILVRKEGVVDISKRIPENLRGVLPEKFPTFVFRNYTIIKDGIVNVSKLPIRVTKETAEVLAKRLPKAAQPTKVIAGHDYIEGVLDLRALPVLNRQMVKEVSAKELFEAEWKLLNIQAQQKVFNSIIKEKFGTKTAVGFAELYGKEAAEWLISQGFTDYSGFSPKQVQAEAKDFYMAKELAIKVKGFSSIPSLNEYRKQASAGKIRPAAALMSPAMAIVDGYDGDEAGFEAWLREQKDKLDGERRRLIFEKAKTVFTLIVGQTWFTEFSSLDENTMTLDFDGQSVLFTAEMKEVKVEI